MAKKKTEIPTLMNKAEVEVVKDEIRHLEGMMKSWAGQKYISDKGSIMKEIREKKKIIETHSAQKYSGEEGNKAYLRAKKLAEGIRKKLIDKKSYYQRYSKDSDSHTKQMDFERAVNHQVALMKDSHYQDMILEYQYHMKRLDPDDPTISNVELLRDNKMFNKIFLKR